MLSRRQMLLSSSAAALALSCGPPPEPARGPVLTEAKLSEVIDRALAAAKRAGATYADVRIVRRRSEVTQTREDVVLGLRSTESYGVGVRVVAQGAWGFAATSKVEGAAAERVAVHAVEMARANAKLLTHPVELAKVAAYKATWATELKVDPFQVPLGEKVELLLAMWRAARDVPEIKHGSGTIEL